MRLPGIDRWIEEQIGPREVGGRYYSGYWGVEYEVVAVHRDPAGQVPWQVTVVYADRRDRVTHRTPWDPRRDRVLSQPSGAGR